MDMLGLPATSPARSRCCIPIYLAALISFGVGGIGSADDAPPDKLSGWQKRFREQAAAYHILVEGESEVRLLAEPVLQWSQPVRGGEEGAVFLWVEDRLPVAIGTFFIWPMGDGKQGVTHEFHSLSQLPLSATWQNRSWKPPKEAVQWKRLGGAGRESVNSREALRQMRELAREFSARSRDKDGREWQLRLLPRPLYRYEPAADDAAAHREIIDGAVFGFVEGTDLELVLLMEFRRTADGDEWWYAAARMSDLALDLVRHDQTVWQVERARYDQSSDIYYCSTVETRTSPVEE